MRLDYISARGDVLPLTDSESFKLVNVDGQTAVMSDISSVVIGGTDGDDVNSMQAQPRTIVLDLRITEKPELTKREILRVIKPKQLGTLRWEQEDKIVEISGVVEVIEMPRWTNAVTMQVTLHCEQPFWEDLDEIVSSISQARPLHYFTSDDDDMLYFTSDGLAFGEHDLTRTRLIYNAGDVAVGLEIEIAAYNTVTNPIIYADGGKFFGCGHGTGARKVTMQAGDIIRITTGKNQKRVTLNGQSILGKVKPRSTWLQLEAGDNTFSIDSDEQDVENMAFSLTYKRRYV